VDFYRRNAAAFGRRADDFLRLFMMPGMAHCRGGDGPDTADWLSVIEAWVEHGDAPRSIMSYRLAPRPPGTGEPRFPIPAASVLLARPVFPFPSYAHYRGAGDPADPASFEQRTATVEP